ncbi:MAG: PilZ domain-containing protein [Deltaproteobacteria bacterium]|nr:PilZ domain-containing protein [Deltaproteobacteria bacterium]
MEEKQNQSDTKEQRRSPRVETSARVEYIIFDNKGKDTDYGEGWAINLSRNGILLETRKSLNGAFVILMTIYLDGKGMKVKGRLVSTNMQSTPGYYFSGIDFIGKNDQQAAAVTAENQNHSGTREQRRHTRIETSTFVKYIIYDNRGKAMGHGKGRTVNLSQSGILLETQAPLQGAFVMLITMDIDGNDVKVKGRLVHSNLINATGHYFSGIDFIGNKDQQVAAIVAFVKSHYRTKSKGKITEIPDNP